jgi:hypothetical protein
MTPADLLAAARDLLEPPALGSVGGWPRAVTLLTRQALETALDEFWAASPATAGLAACSNKTQLTCLRAYLQPAIARQINYVWAALSSACHYHPYDLAPTAGELDGWIGAVTTLLTVIQGNVAESASSGLYGGA